MVSCTCLYIAHHSASQPWRALVGKLMNQGIRVLLPLVDRERCLSAMRVCSVILDQPLYFCIILLNHFNLFFFFWRNSENFHFALVGHLIKGFRHNSAAVRSRTARVLTFLLSIIAKPHKRDKFEVTTDSIAYLTGKFRFSSPENSRSQRLGEIFRIFCFNFCSPGSCLGRGSQQMQVKTRRNEFRKYE